jgi:hypothetical protein
MADRLGFFCFGSLNPMPRRTRQKDISTNPLDYPSTMSLYEVESLTAEATLEAERKPKKPLPKTISAKNPTAPIPPSEAE